MTMTDPTERRSASPPAPSAPPARAGGSPTDRAHKRVRSARPPGTAVELGPDDVVEGRLFAHPDHVPSDRSILCMLIRDVARRIGTESRPVSAWLPSREQWYRRVIVPRPADIRSRAHLTVVGFFGRRRDTVAPEVAAAIQDLSSRLEQRIPEVEGVLAYTTHLLADELNYANLVLLDAPETIARWRETHPHPAAAGRLSAEYYAFVRIYQGSIEVGDLASEGAVRLERVKYWDFRSDPPWTARRELIG